MKKEDIKFILIIILVTCLTVLIAISIEIYKSYFAISDFSNITTILQGTLGIAVSLAGAIVAIRLARISTLIIEKEKQREDSKFYHEVINSAIEPIKNLTISIQEFHFLSKSYDFLFSLDENELNMVDNKILERELEKLKEDISLGFDKIIHAINGITKNAYSNAFWLNISDNRLTNNLMLLKGGGARNKDENMDGGLNQGQNEYIIEDLNQLQSTLKLVLQNFRRCKLTKEDLIVAKFIRDKGFYAPYTNEIKAVDLAGSFHTLITLISLYYNSPYKYWRSNYKNERFENKFLLLILDIFHNLPKKNDLINFSNSIFPVSDEKVIRESPIAKTFDILNQSFWFSFMVTYDLKSIKISDLKSKEYGQIFSNDLCGTTWYRWQLKKTDLDDRHILEKNYTEPV